MAWDGMPLPSLVALKITANTENHDLATLQSLAKHLSGAARKSLLGQFKSLAQNVLPEPTNLLDWGEAGQEDSGES